KHPHTHTHTHPSSLSLVCNYCCVLSCRSLTHSHTHLKALKLPHATSENLTHTHTHTHISHTSGDSLLLQLITKTLCMRVPLFCSSNGASASEEEIHTDTL